MKRLRTILILLFAAMMSLCLFACGGDEDQPKNPVEPEAPAGTVTRVRRISGLSELTDSAEQADIDSMLANVKITIERTTETEDLETVEITAADCDIDGKITPHEVGDYELTFKPRDNNPNNRTITATATVVHDWGAEENLVTNCKYCGARRERNDKENVVIHYGTFHQGIDAVVPDGYEENAVYTNKGTDSRISEFGEVNGRRVPTLTAGTIEKGETITIRGTAKTATGTDSLWTVNNEPKANEQWNSPNLGIADRLRNVTSGYLYGTSVIVRQEGWVLYNGIGDIDDATNTLASIMGGSDDGSKRTSGWRNYGSHLDATETPTPTVEGDNYEKGSLPTDWSTVPDWYVYSDGPIMQSGTFYLTTNYIEYSWTYREDNVIEIRYANYEDSLDNEPTVLKAYIKVPDSLQSGYDTILHGDYNDMTITETEFISKNTPKQFTLNGVKSGAQSVYAENMMFDASTVDLKVEYEQRPGEQSDVTVTNTNVYAYVGNLDYDALKANEAELTSLDAKKWVSLASNRMLKSYKAYKVQLTKGGKSCVELFAKDAITVIPNKVADAVGAAYGDFELDETVGTLAFSLKSTTSATDNAIVLTLGEGYAKAIPQDKTSEFSGEATAAMKYISLRLNATDLATSTTLTDTEVSIKKEGSDTAIPSIVKKEGNDVYLVLALTEAGRYVVTGVQKDTPVILDLSALKGFNVDVAVTNNLGALNTEGTFTLTYTIPADWTNNQIRVGINGGNPTALGNFISDPSRLPRSFGNGFELTAVSREDGSTTLTLTFKAPAANLEGYQPVTVNLEYNGAKQLVTYLDWEATLDASAESMMSAGNGYYVGVPSEHTLNVYYLNKTTTLGSGNGTIRLNINDGNEDNFKANGLITVDYVVSANGQITIANAPEYLTGYSLTYRGTYGENRDTDQFELIILTLDVTKLGLSGDYYFNLANDAFDAENAPEAIIKVSGTTVSEVTLDGTYTTSLYRSADGDCYTEGLYAWKVEKDNKVVFFANAGVAGGSHLDGNSDGKCDLCGGTMSENTSLANGVWFPTDHPSIDIKEGEIITFTGQYADDIEEGGYGSVLAVFIEEYNANWDTILNDEGTNGTYHTTQDGYAIWTNFNWGNTNPETGGNPNEDPTKANRYPYAPNVEAYEHVSDGFERFTSSVITNEHAFNTANGVVNAYGQTMDDVTFNAAKQGGYFRFIITRENGVITTRAQLWASNMKAYHSTPFFEYYTTIRTVSDAQRYTVKIFGKQQDGNVTKLVDNKITVTHSSIMNSQITGAVSAEVKTGYSAPEDLIYTTNTADGRYAVVGVSGTAPQKDGTYYVSFTVNFGKALAATTTCEIVDANGAAIDGAEVTLGADKKSVSVYLPVGNIEVAYLNFINYEASTMQANIKIDLTNVSASDVQATVSADSLTIGESTFTIQYTNAEASDTVVIGSASKTLTELKDASDYTAIAEGVSAKITGESSGTVTVEFKKAAANLEAVISSVEIRLERAGKLLARSVIEPALKIGSAATQIESGDWYVKAVGTKLYLLTNDSSTSPSTVPFNVNAGSKTENALLGVYELAYTVKGGAVSFNETNALTKAATAVYSEGASGKLVVIIIDLTSFGVEADTPYGYALETAEFAKYYTVNAGRTIEEQTVGSGEKEELRASTCVENGVKGLKTQDNTFYYAYETLATSGHDWQEKSDAGADELHGYDKMYTCSNDCGAVKYEQATTQSWGTGVGNNWGSNSWVTFAHVYKGGSYTVTGTNASAGNQIWNLPEPGITDVKDTNADGYRIDQATPFHQNDNMNLNLSYSMKATPAQEVDTTKLNGATITFKFDYSKETELVITVTIVNGGYNYEQVITLTGDNMLDCYYLAFHADENVYTATSAETVVPAGKEVPAALSKHVHQYDSTTHRCPDDGVIDPEHLAKGHTYENGVCVCGTACVHIFEADGTCKTCDLKRTAVGNATTYQATDYNTAFADGDNAAKVTTPLNDNQQVVFKLKLASSVSTVYLGVVTQIWKASDDALRANELAFQQGNNWCLTGAWNTAGKGATGNGNPLAGGDTLESLGTTDRNGYTYEVSVSLSHKVVVITYKVWTTDDTSGTPAYSGTATYSNVEETALKVALGPDGTTFANGITVTTYNLAKAD